jgi:hypothetical protein
METEILPLLLAILICYAIAEFIGRGKHIGKWWTFALLIGGFIPGMIALLSSPSAKENPTKGTKAHIIAGWFFIIILGLIGIIPALSSGNLMTLGYPIAFILTGLYLLQLGGSKIINADPKFYFSNSFQGSEGIPGVEPLKDLVKGFNKSNMNNPHNEHLYYIVEDGVQSEPFTIQQLKEKHIKEDTLVWRHGLANWKRAKDISELKNIIIYTPPPLPGKIQENQNNVASDLNIYQDKHNNTFAFEGERYTMDSLMNSLRNGEFPKGLNKNSSIQTVNGDSIALKEHAEFSKIKQYFPPDLNPLI